MCGLRLSLVALAATLISTPAAFGQAGGGSVHFLLPFDVSQGAVTSVDGITPYIASFKVQLALGLGEGAPLRVGPVGAVRYANPDWTVAGGVRAQWLPIRFGLGGRRWGFGVAAEQLWDTGGHRPASAGLIADFELVRLAGWGVYDWEDERTAFEISVGTDLRSLWAIFSPEEDDDPFQGVQ
jgi:hypothetical protein